MGTGSIVAFVLFLGFASAFNVDMCRVKPPVMQNFELTKLEGRWYEYARYPNLYQYLNKERCNTQDMTVDGDGIRFKTTFINETSGDKDSLYGEMSGTPTKPGKVLVKMPAVGFDDYFSVLDAKYDDYVVFYYCDTLWYFKIELAWVLTREASLSAEKKESLIRKLKTLQIDTSRLEFDSHVNC